MNRVFTASERWKRRVGRFHYALEEDDFFRHHSTDNAAAFESTANAAAVVVVEAPFRPSRSFDPLFDCWIVFVCGIALCLSASLILIRRRNPRIPQRIPLLALPWRKQRRAGNSTMAAKGSRQGLESNKPTRPETVRTQSSQDDANAVCEEQGKQAGVNEGDKHKHGSIRPSCRESPRQTDAVPSLAADASTRTLRLPPPLVMETTSTSDNDTDALVSHSSSSNSASHAQQLVVVSGNDDPALATRSDRTFISTRAVSVSTLEAVTQEATTMATSIKVTQAVFSQHGLEPALATEWAMRRQESEMSEATKQRQEDRRLYMEAWQRHEDRRMSERQFDDMKTSMEYDSEWLEKIHRARNKCFQSCLHCFSLSLIALVIAEIYQSMPIDSSALSVIAALLGCDCDESNMMSLTSSTSRTGWLSGYSPLGAFFSLTSTKAPVCHASCICWRLSSPVCIQLLLKICRCPRQIHEAITVVTMLLLFSSQLTVAASEFSWRVCLPLVLVTLMSASRTVFVTKSCVDQLRCAKSNMRKQLDGSLISLDSIRNEVFLVHVCAVGLLCLFRSA